VLSQAISYGLLLNNVYEKGNGWIIGTFRTIWQIPSIMYWFFVHQIFSYENVVGISGAERLCKFFSTMGKGGALSRVSEWAYLYLRSEHPVRTGILWSFIMIAFAGFHPFKFLLWVWL